MYLPFEKLFKKENPENVALLEVLVDSDIEKMESEENFISDATSSSESEDIAEPKTVYLYGKVLQCIAMLREAEKTISPTVEKRTEEKSELNFLFGFNLLSTLSFPGAGYGLLRSLDNYLSQDIVAKTNSLNNLYTISYNYLTTLKNRFYQEYEYKILNYPQSMTPKWLMEINVDSLLNAPKCLEILPPDISVSWIYREEEKRTWVLNNPIGEVCKYFSENSIKFAETQCDFYKERACFWFEKNQLEEAVWANIGSIRDQIVSIPEHYISEEVITGVSITSAVVAVLGLTYYGYSFFRACSEHKEDLENSNKIGYCLQDPTKINFLINVCEQLQIKLADTPIEEVIKELEKKAEEIHDRRETRYSFFFKCTQLNIPKEITQQILAEADLMSPFNMG